MEAYWKCFVGSPGLRLSFFALALAYSLRHCLCILQNICTFVPDLKQLEDLSKKVNSLIMTAMKKKTILTTFLIFGLLVHSRAEDIVKSGFNRTCRPCLTIQI